MLRKPSHLALIAVAAFSAATLMACSSGSPFLRYLAVSPSSATIIVPGNVESSVRRGAMVASRSSKVKKQLASAPDLNGAGCSTFQYSTTAYFSDGTQRDATSSVVYGSSNTNVATVDAGGVATGLIPGTSQISSQFNGITATPVTLYVNALNSISILPVNSSVPSGGTANFTSTGTFTYWDGTTGSQDLSGVAVWASSNTDVATIDPTSGVATAVGGGSTTISSTVCGVAASTSLTVGSAKPVSLVVTPSSSIIAVGQTQAYTVQELWSDGSKHDVTGNLGWTGNESVLTDEETGLSVGKSAGSGSIGVSEVGTTLTGTSSIDVVPAAARFAYVANTGGAGDLVAQKVTARAATLKSHARPAVKATPQATPQAASTETISAYSVNVTGASLDSHNRSNYGCDSTAGDPASIGQVPLLHRFQQQSVCSRCESGHRRVERT